MNESEQELHSQVLRASKAKLLMENDLLTEALNAIEAEVIQTWGAAPARDKEGKEQAWQLYKTAQKFRGMLLGYIEAGKLAESRLESLNRRVRDFIRVA